MAAIPASVNTVAPFTSPPLVWKSPRMIVGIRPRKSPTNIQAPICSGTAATNSRTAGPGIERLGRSARRAPGRRLTVSAERIATPIPRDVTKARQAKTIFAGEPVNWIAAPVSKAPSPIPPAGATLPMTAPSSLWRGGGARRAPP